MTNRLTFTQLLKEIAATYPEQPRKFHVIATRYYLGAETRETLQMLSPKNPIRTVLTCKQINTIVNNR